jgi:NlpC/P60 family putative phage cell wall peptidase
VTAGAWVVAEAQSWIGTPYRHQASRKGAGTDCLGLVRGVWRGVIGREPEIVPPYTADWDEAAGTDALYLAATRWLVARPIGDAAIGDVLLFRMADGAVAKHLGIQSAVGAAPAFIHAYSGHAVIESPLSRPWARRVVGRFAFPIEGS